MPSVGIQAYETASGAPAMIGPAATRKHTKNPRGRRAMIHPVGWLARVVLTLDTVKVNTAIAHWHPPAKDGVKAIEGRCFAWV
jgi:hypothetical protein